jgi:hypothetical protein
MMVVENLRERERCLGVKKRNERREERVCRSLIFKLLTNRTLSPAKIL